MVAYTTVMWEEDGFHVSEDHAAPSHLGMRLCNTSEYSFQILVVHIFVPMYVVVRFPWTVPMSHLHLALVFENARFGCALFAGGVNIQLVVGILLACRDVAPTLCLNRADLLGVWVGSGLVVDALLACLCWCSSRLLVCGFNVYAG